jgi:hypothetical protein
MLASGIQHYLDLPVVDANSVDEHTVAKQPGRQWCGFAVLVDHRDQIEEGSTLF